MKPAKTPVVKGILFFKQAVKLESKASFSAKSVPRFLEETQMSMRSVSSGAEAYIERVIELNGDEAEPIRAYVLKRTSIDNFCEMLVYRITEFVKSFFGRSDYQVCKATISNSFMNKLIEEGLIQKNPENNKESRFKQKISTSLSKITGWHLELILKYQSENIENISELQADWGKMSFAHYRERIAEIRAKRLSQ